jgi:hypothetical protein
LTLRARPANAMSERRLRKTEATRSFDRLALNALRVFEAVAVRQRRPGEQCDGIHASWPLIESNAENAIANTP